MDFTYLSIVLFFTVWLPVSHQSLQEDAEAPPTVCTNCPPEGAMDIQIKLLPSADSGEEEKDSKMQPYSSEDDSVMKGGFELK